ncbi:carbohydrate kinase family protein [Corallincola spongiicola]|uniref:Carbohydrate kinase family protein n=2 Tax=Corallincola spongiicola TaxID=2520508 RepID=A0ABY1WP03_9GAMM|nr:carbohydrate kinase family protein [Corallincola spongiicola]
MTITGRQLRKDTFMATEIMVSGLINIETTLAIDGFPLNYFPVTYAFDRINTTVSGVGYNVAKALHTLGHPVEMVSMIGNDVNAPIVETELKQLGISHHGVCRTLVQTPTSVILYAPDGQRQIHVDLKQIQETEFDSQLFDEKLRRCQLAVMCNINYNRALLAEVKASGRPIATDVHVLADPDDDYNRDFMAAADILFLSDEGLHGREPAAFIGELYQRYHNQIIVMGRGREGALMFVAEDSQFYHAPAITTRPIINTVGAGDALFSAFVHGWLSLGNPYQALQQAVRFASWKIGEKGAAEGFLNAKQLDELSQTTR